MLNDEKRGIEEAYQCAGSSSNLRVEAERRSDADVLIAAGWTPGMLGSAAIRLRGEWDRSEKPRLLAKIEAQKLAAAEPPSARGATAVQVHYWQQLRELSGKLKSFRAVWDPLTGHMGGDWRASREVIMWWLDQNCAKCGGTKFDVVKGTNRHGAKLCRPCGGSGLAQAPHGQAGRKAANFLDDAVQIARTSIKRRLRPSP